MNALFTKYKTVLEKYSFDKDLFLFLQKNFKEKELSVESNILNETYSLFSDDDIDFSIEDQTNKKNILEKKGLETLAKRELAVLIVNGGMATRFGGNVKGLVPVYDGKSFLELKLKIIQAFCTKYKVEIPIFIMNSINTDEETVSFLEAHHYFGQKDSIACFNQSISMRLNPEGEIYRDRDGNPSFYAPGHGDFQKALLRSGVLHSFIEAGGKYLMFNNVDNLVASIDPVILGAHIESTCSMSFEVTKAIAGDKGGVPLKIKDKKRLVEGFRLPPDFNYSKCLYFNTNTMYFNSKALLTHYELPIAVVEKEIPTRVIQFETVAGELSWHLASNFIEIQRKGIESRFIPVKTQEDLERKRELIKKVVEKRLFL